MYGELYFITVVVEATLFVVMAAAILTSKYWCPELKDTPLGETVLEGASSHATPLQK